MKLRHFLTGGAICLFVIATAPVFAQNAAGAETLKQSADSWFEDGVALFFAGKVKESVAAFDQAIKLSPELAPLL
ncbi:MAG TPA: hypothetical protein VK956_16845, partial [Verrucomicrobium sp.]|nr:hypothetical protein [Verrucomicrobium sp.]